MRNKIISNILSSGVEKIFLMGGQFIASIIIIRLLDRQDFGIIGIVAGYYAFINIVNLSAESIILRDHKLYDENISRYIHKFIGFNLIKAALFIVVAVFLSGFLVTLFKNANFIYSIFSITVLMITDSLVSPFIIYSTAKFNQPLVTKISIIRIVLNLVLLCGLFYYPTLKFIFIKDLIVCIIFIMIWLYLVKTQLNISLKIRDICNYFDFSFIKMSLLSYSLWAHLIGVVTNIIYRSDTFFLSFFVGLSTVGNYNIALNSANVANILPSILAYQNSVAISNAGSKGEAVRITNVFMRISLYLAVVTMCAFYFLGNIYLYLITGSKDNGYIFFYMMCIASALIISKTLISPLSSFISIIGSIKIMFNHIHLPILGVTVVCYWASAYIYGAAGVAVSNIVVAVIFLFLFLKEIKKYEYTFPVFKDFLNDVSKVLMFLKEACHAK